MAASTCPFDLVDNLAIAAPVTRENGTWSVKLNKIDCGIQAQGRATYFGRRIFEFIHITHMVPGVGWLVNELILGVFLLDGRKGRFQAGCAVLRYCWIAPERERRVRSVVVHVRLRQMTYVQVERQWSRRLLLLPLQMLALRHRYGLGQFYFNSRIVTSSPPPPNADPPPKGVDCAGVAAGVLVPKEKDVVGFAGVEENSEPAPADVEDAPKAGVPKALVC